MITFLSVFLQGHGCHSSLCLAALPASFHQCCRGKSGKTWIFYKYGDFLPSVLPFLLLSLLFYGSSPSRHLLWESLLLLSHAFPLTTVLSWGSSIREVQGTPCSFVVASLDSVGTKKNLFTGEKKRQLRFHPSFGNRVFWFQFLFFFFWEENRGFSFCSA